MKVRASSSLQGNLKTYLRSTNLKNENNLNNIQMKHDIWVTPDSITKYSSHNSKHLGKKVQQQLGKGTLSTRSNRSR